MSITHTNIFTFLLYLRESRRRSSQIAVAQNAQKFPIKRKCRHQTMFDPIKIFIVFLSLILRYHKNHTNIAIKPKDCAIGFVKNDANISIFLYLYIESCRSIFGVCMIAKDS